jgi:ABC-type antimicrobial peptide transport system permease subunit
MKTTDYLINTAFILLVVRQARERKLDTRSLLLPLAILAYVAHLYLHAFPTSGNDVVFIGAIALVGLTLGTLAGITTHVRAGDDGVALARVGWTAGVLLVAGIASRMVFVFALSHGLKPAVRSFSVAQSISPAAWTTALVLMAILEVATRTVIVHLRGRAISAPAAPSAALSSAVR